MKLIHHTDVLAELGISPQSLHWLIGHTDGLLFDVRAELELRRQSGRGPQQYYDTDLVPDPADVAPLVDYDEATRLLRLGSRVTKRPGGAGPDDRIGPQQLANLAGAGRIDVWFTEEALEAQRQRRTNDGMNGEIGHAVARAMMPSTVNGDEVLATLPSRKGRGGKVKLRRADVESLAADLEQNSEWMTRAEVARQAGVTGEAVRVAGVKAGWQTTHAWRNEQRSPSRPSNRVLYRRAQVQPWVEEHRG